MPGPFALALCVGFVSFLFIVDRKSSQKGSFARWMIVAYVAMISSRAVSMWFNQGAAIESPEDYIEGSPFDRNIYTAFLILGVLLLSRRKVYWQGIFRNNAWILLFFLYALVSVTWSDFPMVAFKRWVKTLGMVVMVLLVLTDDEPVQCLRWVFRKIPFLLIPFSVTLIKYFPELGKTYSAAGDGQFTGVTTNKNTLGAVCFIYGVYFVWDLLAIRRGSVPEGRRAALIDGVMLLMILYLFRMANSATSLVCFVFGSGLLVFMEMPSVKRNLSRFGVYLMAALLLFAALEGIFGLGEAIVSGLGRDLTFTGRVQIWDQVLTMADNSAIGSGYESFWLGNRAERMWERYEWRPNQAHNGYIEIYLNLGVIGLGLLIMMILTGYKKIILKLMNDPVMGSLAMAYFLAALLFNFSEAAFMIGKVLFIFFLASVDVPPRPVPQPVRWRMRVVPARRLTESASAM